MEGEIVAMHLPRAVYLAVNRTGTLLWPVLADGARREDLVALLRDRFEIDAATAEADVDAFLATLRELELLEEA